MAPPPLSGSQVKDVKREGDEFDAGRSVEVLGAGAGTISTVVFYSADVAEKGVELGEFDEVELVLGHNLKTGEISARHIKVTKEAPKAKQGQGWVKKSIEARTNVIRYAKGPDGTRGFAGGRGRPIAAAAGGGDAI